VLCYFINDAEPMPIYDNSSWLRGALGRPWVVLNYRLDSLRRQFRRPADWKHYYRNLYDNRRARLDQDPAVPRGTFAAPGAPKNGRTADRPSNIPELRELKPYPFADVTAKVRARRGNARWFPSSTCCPRSTTSIRPRPVGSRFPIPIPTARPEIALSKAMVPDIVPLLDALCRKQDKGC